MLCVKMLNSKCSVQNVKCGVWGSQCIERSVVQSVMCKMYSVERGVLRVNCDMQSVEGGVWGV